MSKIQKLNGKSRKNIGGVSFKDIDRKRKQVFKPLLDNPYTQSNLWPFVEPEIARDILELLVNLLNPIGNHSRISKNVKGSKSISNVKTQPPPISKHITVGFNSTVGALESQAAHHRAHWTRKASKAPQEPETERYIKYVFVTKQDITSALLTNPFPVLSVTSSRTADDRVKLIQLPKGSMSRISESLDVATTGFLGLSSDFGEAKPLYKLIESHIKDTQVPWLEPLFEKSSKFQKPALKYLITSAPVVNNKQQKKTTKTTKPLDNK